MAETHKRIEIEGELVLCEAGAVLKRKYSSAAEVIGVLGIDKDSEGRPKTVFLDRLIHRPWEQELGEEWEVGGAISTVLRRRSGEAAARQDSAVYPPATGE